MNKIQQTLTLGAILSTSLVLSGCTKNQTPETTQPQTEAGMMKESQELATAFESGKPMLCTMTDSDNNVAEYAIKGQKMKMSGNNIAQNGKTSNMINDGEWIYIWEEGATEGIKTKMMTEEEEQATKAQVEDIKKEIPDFENPESVQEYKDKGYTINCNPENLNDSVFIPPSNVNFVDFATQMQEMFSGMKQQVPDINNIQMPERVVVEE